MFAFGVPLSPSQALAVAKRDVNKMASSSDVPAIDPVGEPRAPDNPAFVRSCLGWLKLLSGKRGFEHIDAGRPLLTKTLKWDMVVRVDFTINHQSSPGRVDRLICWKSSSKPTVVMFAIGQAAPPLRPPP
jgi:hypothetical protein